MFTWIFFDVLVDDDLISWFLIVSMLLGVGNIYTELPTIHMLRSFIKWGVLYMMYKTNNVIIWASRRFLSVNETLPNSWSFSDGVISLDTQYISRHIELLLKLILQNAISESFAILKTGEIGSIYEVLALAWFPPLNHHNIKTQKRYFWFNGPSHHFRL